jgi:hypothetical protein
MSPNDLLKLPRSFAVIRSGDSFRVSAVRVVRDFRPLAGAEVHEERTRAHHFLSFGRMRKTEGEAFELAESLLTAAAEKSAAVAPLAGAVAV